MILTQRFIIKPGNYFNQLLEITKLSKINKQEE